MQEQPLGTPAEDDQPFPSPMGLLLLGQEVEDSIPSPRQPLAFRVWFFSLSGGVGLVDLFLASFLRHLFLFSSLELFCICSLFSPGGFPC